MTWGDLEGYSTFEKARRKELARRLSRLVRGKDPDHLLSFDDVREQLGLYEQWYVGMRQIPVAKIIGSVARATDFDRAFLPRRSTMDDRWKRVEKAFGNEAFPPIVAFKVGDAYFIEDGHHRVARCEPRLLSGHGDRESAAQFLDPRHLGESVVKLRLHGAVVSRSFPARLLRGRIGSFGTRKTGVKPVQHHRK